ncbi:hypothetical protein I3760_09G089200 [Carya illinoinensis]|uniref:Secreted protein n=1 Tax=Carya illinoinensis TaxID=32201 RepID=A0A922E229_CARIL|nr:hypothetical protein I3760_09G089200 [Carya illinoinensis]KAG6695281.1 hypothetical protein I3842_09G089700 [Carya illinoinensis]
MKWINTLLRRLLTLPLLLTYIAAPDSQLSLSLFLSIPLCAIIPKTQEALKYEARDAVKVSVTVKSSSRQSSPPHFSRQYQPLPNQCLYSLRTPS